MASLRIQIVGRSAVKLRSSTEGIKEDRENLNQMTTLCGE